MGVVNRDIKLENIMLKSQDWQPILKVCDFGYSINENHSMPKTAVGTPGYTGTCKWATYINVLIPINLTKAFIHSPSQG